jgi:hypothetical protein
MIMMHRSPETARPREISLLRVVLLVFAGQIATYYVFQRLFLSGTGVFSNFTDGPDFPFFYRGAQAWLGGRNPYVCVLGFVTPPPSLILPSLLAHLSLARAARVFLVCILAGFLLLGIHVEHATNLMPLTYTAYRFFRGYASVVQSFGVVLMILGTCFSPCMDASEGEAQYEAEKQIALPGDSLPGRSRQAVPAAEL